MRRRELNSEDVRGLVFESILLIAETQQKLDLPICPNIQRTWSVLKDGHFMAAHLPQERGGDYQMAFGAFEPPDTIILDSRIPFCDRPLNVPEVPHTLMRYTAAHEVIHVDEYLGGDAIYEGTKRHMLTEHQDKLDKGMKFIDGEECRDKIDDEENLASLWAMQYVDMIIHYKTYVVLREKNFPRLELVWSRMQDGFFPPEILTQIEREKDKRYVFESIISQVGEYCLIDAMMETASLAEKAACKYTV
ncbi:MAG: hypothetical protein PVH79_04490 [Candidatus Bathyarchaeota archaeon]